MNKKREPDVDIIEKILKTLETRADLCYNNAVDKSTTVELYIMQY